MKYANFLILYLLTLLSLPSSAQENNLNYHKGYYMFPVKPGERNSLAGTMGELRSSHFHAGLDIRTDGRTGLPVHAAADGYISRAAVSVGGYGNALYIQHPNGTTTVYGHLDHFKGAVAEYVKKTQYQRKTFDINLYFDAGDFPVKQGDVIALSGNSGSSGGPHVHFDLRDANQDLLNPLSYGFDEIKDHTPPVVEKIAIKTLSVDSRVNGEFGRIEYAVRRVGNNYVIDTPIPVYGEIGLEMYAYDKLDNSRFKCGINHITEQVKDHKVFDQNITTFAFSEQRNVLRHMDYETMRITGNLFNKLYVDDGNKLRFYDTSQNNGKLDIRDESEYPVTISMTDSYDNTSTLSFTLKGTIPGSAPVSNFHASASMYDLMDNVLKIEIPLNKESSQQIVLNVPDPVALRPAYHAEENIATFLWDLKKGLPESIDYNGEIESLNFKKTIPPDHYEKYQDDQLLVQFPAHSLFDTLYLQTSYELDSIKQREIFHLGNSNVPLRNNITVTVSPNLSYSNREKTSMYALDWRGNPSYEGGEWKDNSITFRTRGFGKFTLMEDLEPPKIIPIKITPDQISFKIYDELSGIEKINCYVNGDWVLMNYDYKRQLIWSEKKDPSINFSGEIKLVVLDNVNNEKIFTTKLP